MTPEFDKDRTFDRVSACGSDRWVAAILGSSVEWLRKHRGKLEAEGFPPKDPLIGLTLKADVEAFLAKRRRVSDPAPAGGQSDSQKPGVNYGNV